MIPTEGHLVIWCDGLDVIADGIHASFMLSPDDGSLAIVHADAHGELIVSEVPITGSAGAEISIGRAPDGTASWLSLSPPTPGGPNEATGPVMP